MPCGWRCVWVFVASAGIAGCSSGAGRSAAGSGLGHTFEGNASDRTREDLGIDRWRVAMVGNRSVSVVAIADDGGDVADANVSLTSDTWRTEMHGRWEGVLEIELSGDIVRDTNRDMTLLDYCSNDFGDGFRAGPGSACSEGATVTGGSCMAIGTDCKIVGQQNGQNVEFCRNQQEQCALTMMMMMGMCAQAAAPAPADGDTSNGSSDTNAGGESGSAAESGGGESGGGGSSGSGGSSGGGESGGGGSSGEGGGSSGGGTGGGGSTGFGTGG